jgi:serine/threonine-protein kinase
VETLQSTQSSAGSVSSHATPGTLLAGKYRVLRVLGQGGMAVVVAAKHLQLRETVAVKLLHPHVLANPRSADRFLREARVTMRLRGEHVARIYDVGALEDGTPFVVMECLEGADLGALLRERGRFTAGEAVDCVLQACEAVAEAHALGVVHRDLKPANLFLTTRIDGSPCVKVLDFGISKTVVEHPDEEPASSAQLPRRVGGFSGPFEETAPPSMPAHPPEVAMASTLESGDRASRILGRGETSAYSATAPATITLTHAFLGSPKYAAPEQLLCARDVDARVDVWALGVILHELVNGVPPFQGTTLEEISEAIVHGEPAPFVVKDPARLEALLAACLAKDRADRYASISALAEALEPLATKEGRVSAERVVRMASGGRRASEPPPGAVVVGRGGAPVRRRTRVVLAWAAPAVVAAVVGGAMLAREPSHPRAPVPSEPLVESAQPAAPRETAAPPAPPSVATAVVLAPLPSSTPATSATRTPESKHAGHGPAPRGSASADPLGVPGGMLFDTRR